MDFHEVIIMSVIVAIISLIVYFINKRFTKIDERYQEKLSKMTIEEKEKERKKAKKMTSRKRYTVMLPIFIFIILIKYEVDFALSGLVSIIIYLLSKIIWKKYFENKATDE